MEVPVCSARARRTLQNAGFKEDWEPKAKRNEYHEESNPQGIINIGRAENKLSTELLLDRMSQEDMAQMEESDLYYPVYHGSQRFRDVLAAFLNRKLNTRQTLLADNMLVTSGVGSALDLLAHAVGDPGDCILVPAPYYFKIRNDMGDRGQLKCWPVHTDEQGADGRTTFKLTLDKLVAAYHEAIKEGERVRGILLINPHNPLGEVYEDSLIPQILSFAAKEKLHVISDEIYALSVFEGDFTSSVTQVAHLPDPSRTHVVWGFSKDLTLSGYRIGLIHSWNLELLAMLRPLCYLNACPAVIQRQMSILLADTQWLDNVFFPHNLAAMLRGRNELMGLLDKLQVPYTTPKAGFFIWADFSRFLSAATEEGEVELFKRIFEAGVYALPGVAYYGRTPGFFRLVFTTPPELLHKAFERLHKMLGK